MNHTRLNGQHPYMKQRQHVNLEIDNMNNPDYIDDYECREARRIERDVINDLAWLVEKETNSTRTLSEQIRSITRYIHIPDYDPAPRSNYTLPHINTLSEIAKYRAEYKS